MHSCVMQVPSRHRQRSDARNSHVARELGVAPARTAEERSSPLDDTLSRGEDERRPQVVRAGDEDSGEVYAPRRRKW